MFQINIKTKYKINGIDLNYLEIYSIHSLIDISSNKEPSPPNSLN